MPRAVCMAQDQFAGGKHAFDRGLKQRAVGQPVGVLFAQPVHSFAVGVLEGLLFAPFELGVTPQAADQKGFEQPAAVELAAPGLREGDGVGQRGVERRLVDVDADAGDRAGEEAPAWLCSIRMPTSFLSPT